MPRSYRLPHPSTSPKARRPPASPFVVLAVALSLGASELFARGSVRILRDPWGVPHVIADTDYGAGYGYGYALARDQLVPALSALWTAQGRRTEIDGRDALPFDRSMRLLRVTAAVEDAFDGYSRPVQDVSRGFADGFNAYMREHPERVPHWAEPIDPSWPMGLGRVIQFIPVVRRFNRELGNRPGRLSLLDSGTSTRHLRIYGSNAWALGPARTVSNRPMMLTDPHLPWKNEFRLYEVHLRGATFEVAGAAFIGVPLPVFARNDRVSWAWTWNQPDHADVYRLELDPSGDRYRFGGRWVRFETERHRFRLPDGSAIEETLRWSRHGPVTHVDLENRSAVAARMTVMNLLDAPEQAMEMIRARTVEDLERAMARLQIPHFNLVAADADGRIAYIWSARVPRYAPGEDHRSIRDGSDPTALWDEDDVVAWDELPAVRNPEVGFVQSCNNRPDHTTGTEADPRPDTYPPAVVAGGEVDSMRAWYLRRRLAEKERFDEDEARALALDNYMIPHLGLIPQLRAAWERFGERFPQRDRIRSAVRDLLSWNGYPSRTSTAATFSVLWLFETFGGDIMLPTDLLERDPAALDDEDLLRLLHGVVRARARMEEMAGGLTAVPWGLIHVIRKNGAAYPVESGMYPAISLWNANLDVTGGSLTDVTARVGSAYTAFSVFDDPVRTYSLTPLGQTDDEDLPYCDAVTRMYADRNFKFLPFTDDQLAEVETVETELEFDSH